MVVSDFKDKKFLLVIGGVTTYKNTKIRHSNSRFSHRDFEPPELIFGIEITDYDANLNSQFLDQ